MPTHVYAKDARTGAVLELVITGEVPVKQRLTIEDVAKRYQKSKRVVQLWVKAQVIPFFRIGREVFFDPDTLDQWEKSKANS